MSTSLAYHTQGIVEFQHHFRKKRDSASETEGISLSQMFSLFCQCVLLVNKTYPGGILWKNKSLFLGGISPYLLSSLSMPFWGRTAVLFHSKPGISKALERTIVELHPGMTIHAISKYFHLAWRIGKACEKCYSKHKFWRIKLKHVKLIGSDEIAIGHTEAGKRDRR